MNISKIKNIKNPIIFFAVIVSLMFQCTTKSSEENNDSIKVTANNTEDIAKAAVNSKGSLLNSILFTNNNVERASFIGKKITEATSKETAEIADSASNYKGFTSYFNNSDDEFVDIQYFNNGVLVTAVNFDIYLNEQPDVDKLYADLLTNFNSKYGKSVTNDKETTWQLPNGQTLLLKDVSVKLAPGLQIKYAIQNSKNTIE